MKRFAPVLVLVAFVSTTIPVREGGAHTRSRSFSSWRVSGDSVEVLFTVRAFEATRLPREPGDRRELTGVLADHLARELDVRRADVDCPVVGSPRVLAAREGYLRVELTFGCPLGEGAIDVSSGAFFDVAPSHVHIARVLDGSTGTHERLLTVDDRDLRIVDGSNDAADAAADGAAPARRRRGEGRDGLAAYVALGVEHILAGVDHLAFLLGLLLLARGVREVVLLVTGFTLGHSVTLALGVLGAVRPDQALVEAMIGFTIALVAVENVAVDTHRSRVFGVAAACVLLALGLARAFTDVGPPVVTLVGLALFAGCYLPLATSREASAGLRPMLTVVFGLVHGFGFAGVLQEIGLPAGRRLTALLGFNLGVEVGQLAVVIGLASAGALLARATRERRIVALVDVCSAILAGLGLFWFFSRAYV